MKQEIHSILSREGISAEEKLALIASELEQWKTPGEVVEGLHALTLKEEEYPPLMPRETELGKSIKTLGQNWRNPTKERGKPTAENVRKWAEATTYTNQFGVYYRLTPPLPKGCKVVWVNNGTQRTGTLVKQEGFVCKVKDDESGVEFRVGQHEVKPINYNEHK